VKLGAFSVSAEYEGMRFGESARVPTTKLSNLVTGVALQNSMAYQPESRSDFFSLKVTYTF